MADEEEVIDVVKEKSPMKMVVILMVLSVLVMVLTPLITVFAFQAMSKKDAGPDPKESTQHFEIPLSKIQVNIKGTNGMRYLQFIVVVKVTDKEMNKFFIESGEDGVGKLRKMQSEIIKIASDTNLTALLSYDGKLLLAGNIKKKLNDILAPETKGTVSDVYFSEFLIQ